MPTEMEGLKDLTRRRYRRGERPEYRFYADDPWPRLPISRNGQFQFARWGNGCGQSRHLPRSTWTLLETIKDGTWRDSGAVNVTIRASFAFDGRGVWYPVFRGIRGILVPDEKGIAICYLLREPASKYYLNETGSPYMPVFIDQQI